MTVSIMAVSIMRVEKMQATISKKLNRNLKTRVRRVQLILAA